MVSISKHRLITIGMIITVLVFGLGFFVGRNLASDKNNYDLPQNIQVDAKALISSISIQEVAFEDGRLAITFETTIKPDMNELITKQIIDPVYTVPVKAETVSKDGDFVSLIPVEAEHTFDFSQDATFKLYFDFSDETTEAAFLEDTESINVVFKFNNDPTNIYEYVTSHIYLQ